MEMKHTLRGRGGVSRVFPCRDACEVDRLQKTEAKDGGQDQFLPAGELDRPDDGHGEQEDEKVGDWVWTIPRQHSSDSSTCVLGG